MNIKQYVAARIHELQVMQAHYESNNKFDETNWPLNQDEVDWYEQELAFIENYRGGQYDLPTN